MLDIALLLHIYQPPTQFPKVTRNITERSYKRIIWALKEAPNAKIVVNMCASLTEQLDQLGYQDVISDFAALVQEGRVELTGSAKYHPLLSKLPQREILHQIRLNQETNERLLGSFNAQGFFPPEMAYSSHVGRAIERLGFNWVIIEDVAFPGDKERKHDVVYRIEGTTVNVFFRDKDLSLGFAFADFKRAEDFLRRINKQEEGGYRIIALDGETFGHHHNKADHLLRDILNAKNINWSTISEIEKKYQNNIEETQVLPCTWGVMEITDKNERLFPRWDNPQNPLHIRQWQLYYLALSIMSRSDTSRKGYLKARSVFDKAVHSDHFFWAGGNPCWHPVMVGRGAQLLLDVIELNPDSFEVEKEKARLLVKEIRELGKEIYGEDVILGR